MSDEITLGNISSLSSPATDLIARAAGPLIEGDYFFRELINALPAAVYTTDPYGRITYYNEAAAAFSGCRPELGKSDWCGSWKLFWAGWPGIAARSMSDGCCSEGAASDPGRGSGS